MSKVVSFPGHHWAHCEDRECRGCHLCHGGLAVCTTCGGAEGTLTTDCPQEFVGWEKGQRVYEGLIDYRRKVGWVELKEQAS